MFVATCKAPVNIALIKYWGKKDEDLILPINDSLSMTLSTDEMCAQTTVAASEDFKLNRMWLNGEELAFEKNLRLMRCLNEIKNMALANCNSKISTDWKLHIVSRNNFPTAAGLASSAAGYACLVYTLARLYGLNEKDFELSAVARLGSGSACRSLHGGFVRWQMGTAANGKDSFAVPVAPAAHWPEMRVLILVVNDARKKTSSTHGMRRSMETSQLIMHRANQVVPKRIEEITKAIEVRDFEKFAEITMRDSNQFHAIALDTYPPCVYMNDVSHAITDFVHNYNQLAGSIEVAYTFDAGPNACLYLLSKNVPSVLEAIKIAFPNDEAENVEFVRGIAVAAAPKSDKADSTGNVNIEKIEIHQRNLIKYIIHSRIGNGPQQLKDEDSLINLSNGLPI